MGAECTQHMLLLLARLLLARLLLLLLAPTAVLELRRSMLP